MKIKTIHLLWLPLVFMLTPALAFADQQASTDQQASAFPSLQSVLPALSGADSAALAGGEPVLLFHPEEFTPALLPLTTLSGGTEKQMMAGELNVGMEGLFFTPSERLPAGFMRTPEPERELVLYNILRSMSTLEGLEYYSASRGEMRTLFEECWILYGPDSRIPLPDPSFEIIPSTDVEFVHQKDKTFGTNVQEITYTAADNAFAAAILNRAPLRYKGLIKMVNSRDMQIHLIVVPVREGVLVYGSMSARTRNIKGFQERARNSFTTRVIALTGWYEKRLNEEFAALPSGS